MNIREFRDDDLSAVIALWQSCDLTRPWNPPERDIELCRRSGHGTLFVAEAADHIVGTIMVGHDGHRGWVYYVAVDPARRRDGLGRILMKHAEDFLAAQGVPKIMLLIRETNSAVAAFYERLGYQLEPRLLMTKSLAERNHDRAD
jgi:ribosomal protein S18 acetylase RimI-like enzyme